MTTFADSAYLLKVTAYEQDETDVEAVPTTFYPAATVGRSTSPTDTPANTYVPAAFTGAFNYGLELFSGNDPSQSGRLSLGVLDLIDPSGGLDFLTGYVWDGATIELLRGDPAAAFSTYSSVAKLSAAGMVWDTRQKQIQLRALDHVLTAPLHDTRYSGAGLYDGDSTLVGVIRPILYGRAFNITPVQINATTLVYQVSCTSVEAIDAVRDGGVARPLDATVGTAGDCADYATLVAATIVAGRYITCKALGLFRLADVPAYGITCDARGDNDTINGATYTALRAGIIRRIATGRGNSKLTTAQIDDATFTAMDIAQPGECGFYFAEESTKAEAIAEVAAGCLGYWWFTIAGLFSVDYLTEVAASADYTLTVPTIGQGTGTGGDVIGEPAMQAHAPPRQATFLGYRHNYTIQPQASLAGSVTQADVAIYAAEMRKLGSQSEVLAHINPTAPIVVADSGFTNDPDDTQDEATRQQTLLGVPRVRWSVKVRLDPFGDWLNKTFSVNGWQRFGFAGEKRFLCVGVSVQGRNEVALDLWGAL